MYKHDENLLLYKASQGDSESFGLIFDRYGNKIYRYIYFRVKNKEIAEDLASQSFLKTWEFILAGKTINQLKPFIYRTARNLIIDYYRSRDKEELPLLYTENEADESICNIDPDKNIDKELLEKLLTTLPDEQREIIILRYIEDLSIKEISKITDKSAGNIRIIIHRSIKELRKYA